MSLGLQDLKSHLWDCAEILRGSAVDRTDWKAYILPLLFFKRICDVWDEEAAATLVYGDVDAVDFPEVHHRPEWGRHAALKAGGWTQVTKPLTNPVRFTANGVTN